MKKQVTVVKSNGDVQIFDSKKLFDSLIRAGASIPTVHKIVEHIEAELEDGVSTMDIYRHAFDLLHREHVVVATRYSLRRALLELGPSGFVFERVVCEIFRAKGYEAVTDQVVYGGCVEHELDVVAWKENELVMIEAKFHNELGLKSDLKVALYVKARFEDLANATFNYGGMERKMTRGILITNTKFTDHAIRYAECNNLELIGWNYPKLHNLEDLITETKTQPLTCLTSLSLVEKQNLVKAELLLCKDIVARKAELATLGVDADKVDVVVDEAHKILSGK